MRKFTVVIPTINENETIVELAAELLRRYPEARVIVADDGSTDGTREAVKRLAKKNPRVALLDRSGSSVHGLTASVLDAAGNADTGFIVVMDGDLQHPPERVRAIVSALELGNDVAVGYRTRIGGEWGLYRRLMSKTAEGLGRLLLRVRGAPSCKDVLSGFFGVKRNLLVNTCTKRPAAFELRGYKVLLDLLKVLPRETRVADVGYEFGMRMKGKSKIGARHILLYLRSLLR